MRDQLAKTLIAPTAKKLRQLLLERPLQDQPRAQPTDRLDRIVLITDTSDQISELAADRSLVATLAIRAYLLVDYQVNAGGYARLISRARGL